MCQQVHTRYAVGYTVIHNKMFTEQGMKGLVILKQLNSGVHAATSAYVKSEGSSCSLEGTTQRCRIMSVCPDVVGYDSYVGELPRFLKALLAINNALTACCCHGYSYGTLLSCASAACAGRCAAQLVLQLVLQLGLQRKHLLRMSVLSLSLSLSDIKESPSFSNAHCLKPCRQAVCSSHTSSSPGSVGSPQLPPASFSRGQAQALSCLRVWEVPSQFLRKQLPCRAAPLHTHAAHR